MMSSTTTSRIRARPRRRRSRRLVTRNDVVIALELPAVLVVGAVVPRAAWPRLAAAYVDLRVRVGARRHRKLVASLAAKVPPSLGTSRDVARELEIHRYLHYLDIARLQRRSAEPPPVEVTGTQHLDDALADGNGAILLVGHFVHNGLAPKMGLAQAGYSVTHLSRPEHGFSKTRLGIRVLNPIRRRVEDRYLARRVVISADAPARAVRALANELARNGVVSITAGAWEGTRIIETELLGASYPIATGAFSLSRFSGAPILPLIAERSTSTGELRVIIEPPLTPMADADRSKALLATAAAAIGRFAPHVARLPGQFRGWNYLESVS